jgi:putative transposase
MLHSYTRIFVHFVWATKNREKVLTKDVRPRVYQHIAKYANENGIVIKAMNVQMDHVHCLIDVASNQNVDYIVKLLKGESSHWINEKDIVSPKFLWQRGYGAFSMSPSHIEKVIEYIANQDEHHRKVST